MKPLRYAVIGTGFWAHYQIAAWKELAGVELVALYNRTRSRAEEMAAKYGVNNWRDDGGRSPWIRTYSSIQRHLNAWHSGEDLDPESGKSHLAHAATQLLILMIHQMEHPECDDRYKKDKQ